MLTKPGHIDVQLKEQLMSQKEKNRDCLLKIVQSISYLSCQGIALHKDEQDEESNFMPLCHLQAEGYEMLQKWIDKSYDKHMSLNEILQIMALKVLHGIASDIAESGYYSIMADQSTDASNIEQLVIYIHCVDKMTVHGIYWSDASRSDKCRYNCCLHQRCAAAYESQNSRCSWATG